MENGNCGPEGKTVVVIGAGSSGLAAIKCCKEDGINVVCYERTNNIGGLWRYHENDEYNLASVMKSTVINSSKEMSAFSDFPPPKEFSNYMRHSEMFRYLQLYAETFRLYGHIRYNREVISVDKADDYDVTGRYEVTTKDTKSDVSSKEVFDGVMVCIGHHVFPHVPNFPGQEKFEGKIIHTHSLKTNYDYKDLNVLVIGAGNSGLDAAVEISNVAKQVYLSTRRGFWVIPRIFRKGRPVDLQFTRLIKLFINIVGWNFFSRVLENVLFDHSLYGLKPTHRLVGQHVTLSDYLQPKILTGSVRVKKNITEFVKNGVIFEGEDSVTLVDSVVLATGYVIKFSFLKEDIVNTTDNKVDLYKFVFPPNLKHPTLAFIGLIQPNGAIFPIAESQSRWFASLINGKRHLPDDLTMQKQIRCRQKANQQRYVASPRHTVQVDYMWYMDELAEEFGAKPNLLKYLFSDPQLFIVCFLGSFVSYQFRLQGPHPWSGAREAILNCSERVDYALNYKEKKSNYSHFSTRIIIRGTVLLCLALFIFIIIFTRINIYLS